MSCLFNSLSHFISKSSYDIRQDICNYLEENIIEYEMDIKEAVDSPRFHSQWFPDVIMTEPRGLAKDVVNNLKARGHNLIPYKWGYIGEANGIMITEHGYYGGGDNRGETSAVGY